jgi:phosphoribosyl-AMP cyclohydrolase
VSQEIEEAGRELDMYAVLSIPDATAELMCACKRRHIILSCPVRFDMNEGPIWNPYESSRPSMDMIETFVKTLRTDRTDRLFTTVVTDESGVALGLVYSNMDSIRASLDSGRGVYWSRSRGELWRKGETSGSWQTLLSITADCDSDAIRFMVIQHGV